MYVDELSFTPNFTSTFILYKPLVMNETVSPYVIQNLYGLLNKYPMLIFIGHEL